jgi:tetratricopeptide (TPR) repeat protein
MAPDAAALNGLGNDLKDEGRWSEAEEAYRRAVMAAPEWPAPWFNLGLLYKLRRSWEDSLMCGLRATELAPDDQGAWWNLGIAATALGNWAIARRAWLGCGIAMPEGDGPPVMNLGPIPIRLDPDAAGEVVWCDRIDPARAVVRSVPLPGSRCHELDLVLHDGEPNGFRIRDGRRLPVFDALEVLERSDRQTLELRLAAPGAEDVRALARLADTMDMTVEDWTATVRPICRQCSEGVPHDEHDEAAAVPWSPLRHVGISARVRHEADELLTRWAGGAPGRRVIEGSG